MDIVKYSEWSDTAETLQLISQMLGKVKLQRVHAQPSWGHVLLELTPNGFTTGMIPNGDKNFTLTMDVRNNQVIAETSLGEKALFELRSGVSISEYYSEFNEMLAAIICHTKINTTPQEMVLKTPFEDDLKKRTYEPDKAYNFFEMCLFAYNGLSKFIAPFRNRKIGPALFWGTFDVSTAIFTGEEKPFPGNTVIERSAFDEQMLEFGFWPGDSNYEVPSFFILPYPFLAEDLGKEPIQPEKAFYSAEKAEFFLSLEDLFSYKEPEKVFQDFLNSGFQIITKHEKWKNVEWFTKPLLMPVQP